MISAVVPNRTRSLGNTRKRNTIEHIPKMHENGRRSNERFIQMKQNRPQSYRSNIPLLPPPPSSCVSRSHHIQPRNKITKATISGEKKGYMTNRNIHYEYSDDDDYDDDYEEEDNESDEFYDDAENGKNCETKRLNCDNPYNDNGHPVRSSAWFSVAKAFSRMRTAMSLMSNAKEEISVGLCSGRNGDNTISSWFHWIMLITLIIGMSTIAIICTKDQIAISCYATLFTFFVIVMLSPYSNHGIRGWSSFDLWPSMLVILLWLSYGIIIDGTWETDTNNRGYTMPPSTTSEGNVKYYPTMKRGHDHSIHSQIDFSFLNNAISGNSLSGRDDPPVGGDERNEGMYFFPDQARDYMSDEIGLNITFSFLSLFCVILCYYGCIYKSFARMRAVTLLYVASLILSPSNDNIIIEMEPWLAVIKVFSFFCLFTTCSLSLISYEIARKSKAAHGMSKKNDGDRRDHHYCTQMMSFMTDRDENDAYFSRERIIIMSSWVLFSWKYILIMAIIQNFVMLINIIRNVIASNSSMANAMAHFTGKNRHMTIYCDDKIYDSNNNCHHMDDNIVTTNPPPRPPCDRQEYSGSSIKDKKTGPSPIENKSASNKDDKKTNNTSVRSKKKSINRKLPSYKIVKNKQRDIETGIISGMKKKRNADRHYQDPFLELFETHLRENCADDIDNGNDHNDAEKKNHLTPMMMVQSNADNENSISILIDSTPSEDKTNTHKETNTESDDKNVLDENGIKRSNENPDIPSKRKASCVSVNEIIKSSTIRNDTGGGNKKREKSRNDNHKGVKTESLMRSWMVADLDQQQESYKHDLQKDSNSMSTVKDKYNDDPVPYTLA